MMPFSLSLSVLCFGIAVFSAGIGVGGGTLLVTLLIALKRYEFSQAAALSLATIIPISCVGAVYHHILLPAPPQLQYYYIFIPACVAGTIAGAVGIKKKKGGILKCIFGFLAPRKNEWVSG